MKVYHGGCHCGAVKFKVTAEEYLTAHACNCSICKMNQLQQVIVPEDDFELLGGQDALSLYTFNTGAAKHYFCKICGVKSFYRPRSNPDGVSINVHCLEDLPAENLTVEPFDGQNWEANAASLAHLSQKG